MGDGNYARAVARLYLKNVLGEATALRSMVATHAVSGIVSRDAALTFSDFSDRTAMFAHQVSDTLCSMGADVTPFAARLHESAQALEMRRVEVWRDLQRGRQQFQFDFSYYRSLHAYVTAVIAGIKDSLNQV
jgi:hypothetical protein